MDNLQGNASTIGVMIWTILCPYISTYISQDIFLAIFGLLIVIWSAYNPNTFKIFKNAIPIKEPVTDDPISNDNVTGDEK